MTLSTNIAAALLAGSVATSAAAQLSERPYDFPDGGGLGMSVAARQAIVLNEIDPGFTPDALMRAPSGDVLVPVPLPRGADDDVPVLVGPFTGQVLIPPYHLSLRSGAGLRFGAGFFSAFFAGGSGYGHFWAPRLSTISVWTGRVLGAGGFGHTNDSINDWTAAAYVLGDAR